MKPHMEKAFDYVFYALCLVTFVCGFAVGGGWSYPATWALPRLMIGMAILMAFIGCVFDFLLYRGVKSALGAAGVMVFAAVVITIVSALLGYGVVWFFTPPPLE